MLGDNVDDDSEKYGLNWHGKRAARQLALIPSTGTLRPDKASSVDWDNTKNVVIEGDNLEVLKLLQKSYSKKVKLIYIDPPYNTGNDFVYPDDRHDTIRNYQALTGQLDDDNRKITSNTEASGRFHTDWLNMMYPRLKLAERLLTEDGAMVIHIDEHEHAHLETMLSEIFGDDNILGAVVWTRKTQKATRLAYQHEEIIIVARDQREFALRGGLRRKKKNAHAILAKATKLMKVLGKRDIPDDLKEISKRYSISAECLRPYIREVDLDTINRQFSAWIKKQSFSGGEAAYDKIDANGDVYRLVSMAWPNKKQAPPEYFEALIHPTTGLACLFLRRDGGIPRKR